MAITQDQIKIIKVLSGFFYEQDFRYEQLKGVFFNEVRDILQIEGLELLSLGDMDILKTAKRLDFEFRMTNENFNYQDIFSSKNDFISKSVKLAKAWQERTGKGFTKIGGVIHFQIHANSLDVGKYITSYYSKLPSEQLRSTKLHFNYFDLLNGKKYNVNFSLSMVSEPKVLLGSIDLNLDKRYFDFQEGEGILDDVFAFQETQLLKLLENK